MGRTTFWLLEQEQKAKEETDWEEEVKQYHNGSGWYDVPGYDKAKRKDEAIETLKEADKYGHD